MLEDAQGHRYGEWPDHNELDVDWVAPDPDSLAKNLATIDVTTFYHTVLPLFFEWPDLSVAGSSPSSCSDGYQWMRALATWLASPVFEQAEHTEQPRDNASLRMSTAEIASGRATPIGHCGDAWALTMVGDACDVIDHRPYINNARTPVGLCADAPILVLYPERGAVDWSALLPTASLRPGTLTSGANVWVVYLTPADRQQLLANSCVTLSDMAGLLARDEVAFTHWTSNS